MKCCIMDYWLKFILEKGKMKRQGKYMISFLKEILMIHVFNLQYVIS